MFDAILKATNSSFQEGMLFSHSVYVMKVMKLLCFPLFLSIRLSLNVKFVHIKSLRYSACQMRTQSLMQE